MKSDSVLPSSFRDPSGFLFIKNKQLYRQINKCYLGNYNLFIKSGLYQKLVDQQLLIPHQEITTKVNKIIKPKLIDFISYPYEWCFSQLKDTALLTLKIQKLSLQYKMTLKDASAFNIQFYKGQPILIDSLSFEKYIPGQPWIAYRQFCQHFLAPLALMSYTDLRLNQLLKIYLDGIPLDLTSKLLSKKTWFNLGLLTHIHLHNKSQQYFKEKKISHKSLDNKMSLNSLLTLIDSLEKTIKNLNLTNMKSNWIHYYQDNNYSKNALDQKKQIVEKLLKEINPKTTWDLGANIGVFSLIASQKSQQVISFDNDPLVIELNYLNIKKLKKFNILPLVQDLTNPSPAIGWQNQERLSLYERKSADVILALALIHHLAIVNNVPLNKLAKFFSHITRYLIIEFVPKNDSQVQTMLKLRKDIFSYYTQENFEKEFKKYFKIKTRIKINNSKRSLYFMEKI